MKQGKKMTIRDVHTPMRCKKPATKTEFSLPGRVFLRCYSSLTRRSWWWIPPSRNRHQAALSGPCHNMCCTQGWRKTYHREVQEDRQPMFFANIMEPVGWSWFGQLHLGQFEKQWTTYKTCWVSEKSWLFLWWNATIFWDVNKKQLHKPFSKISFRRRTIIPEEKELIQQVWVVCHVMIRSHLITWVFGYHIPPINYGNVYRGYEPPGKSSERCSTQWWPPTNRHREMHWINCSSLKIFKQKRRRYIKLVVEVGGNPTGLWAVTLTSWLFVVCKGLYYPNI